MVNAPSPARYLLRFDDICPTMNWTMWAEIESALDELDIKPIVAVIPRNEDPALMVDDPRVDFWERVCEWQRQGWAIGLHGFRHKYRNRNSGILGLTPQSEFAGVARDQQRADLQAGIDLFARRGVRIDCWVAPSHSFDWTTVELLAALDVRVISDGLWPRPHTDHSGVTWVPQQLWNTLLPKPGGVWTACYHHNGWTRETFRQFDANLRAFRSQITTLDAVTDEYRGHPLRVADRVAAWWTFNRHHRARQWRAQLRPSQRRVVATAASGAGR